MKHLRHVSQSQRFCKRLLLKSKMSRCARTTHKVQDKYFPCRADISSLAHDNVADEARTATGNYVAVVPSRVYQACLLLIRYSCLTEIDLSRCNGCLELVLDAGRSCILLVTTRLN